MRSRLIFRSALVLLAFTFGLQASSQASAVPNRITAAVNNSQAVPLQGNVSPRLRLAVDQGEVSSAQQFTDLTLNFLPSAAQEASLEALLAAQQDPASASYHAWLTPAQYGAQFGMSDADLAKVSAWLQGQGFTVGAIPASRNAIHFSGTAGQIASAFHAAIHSYSVDGETHFANATEPMLPAAFAGVVSSVRGMNDFRAKAHVRRSTTVVPYPTTSAAAGAIKPNFVSSGSQYLSPEDFSKIYDVKALYNSGFSGSASFPIAVVGQTAIQTTDITDFRSAFSLSAANLPTLVLMPGTGTSAINSNDDLGEAELDLEWSGAVAPSAPIYFIYTGNNLNYGVFDALQYAIQSYTVGGKVVPIISNSYGECENSGDTLANFNTYESWFKQANAQGQTVLSASGDAGAADCDNSPTSANSYQATLGLQVDYPASSAYVTGMGGTSFSGDLTNSSTYWGTTNDATYGNQLGLYIPSSVWNNTPSTATAVSFKGLSAGGGGASTLWPKPSWQAGVTGIPADGKRDVPDISLAADPNHDGYLLCESGSCRANPATFSVVGGTSAAAPSFAGILALIEQKLGAAQGNINPVLYSLATNSTTYASAFHDITTGSNIVPCVVNNGTTVTGDTGCTSGTMGFNAGTGYDQASGLGDVDANNLANAFSAVAAKTGSTTTISVSPATPIVNSATTFTATVSANSGSAVPTGTVVFTVDSASSGTTATVAGGKASFTTTFSTGGSHTVSAVYSGDTTFNPSTGSLTTTITVPTGSATTTTLTSSKSAATIGSSLTLTANVASTVAGTLAGTVTFNAGSTNLGTAQIVAGSGGNTGTATLVVTVSATTLPVGTDTITAAFGGGGTAGSGGAYSPSTSTAVSVVVTNPQITLSASPSSITIASGGTVTSTITVTSVGGYAGTVTFSTPSITGYTFTPASVAVAAGGTATSVFSVTGVTAAGSTGTGTLLRHGSGVSSVVLGSGAAFAGLLFFGLAGKCRRRVATLFSLVIFGMLAAGMGCSSSSNTGSGSTAPVTGTITIVGTDSSLSSITNTTTLTVTLQ